MSRRGPVPPPEWYSIHRAARELAVTPALIESNINAGRIRAEERTDQHGRTRLMLHRDEIARLRGRNP